MNLSDNGLTYIKDKGFRPFLSLFLALSQPLT